MYLLHYGVQGQKWGVRKNYDKVKKLHRISKTEDESSVPDGYYTTSKKQARYFKSFVKDNDDIPGVKVFDMTIKLKDLIVTPSEKEEVEIQLNLLKNKKVKDLWSETLADQFYKIRGGQEDQWELQDAKARLNYLKTPASKKHYGKEHDDEYDLAKFEYARIQKDIKGYRKDVKNDIMESITISSNHDSLKLFSMAVFGSPELRKLYRETIMKKGYNAVEDHWGQDEIISGKKKSPSAIMILDKRIFKNVKVKK